MEQIHWLGVRIMKPPDDLWAYQEIIHETRPDVIVETGTAHGGSSHYMATLCDIVGNGRVLTIDTREHVQPSVPAHPRLTFIEGSSIDDQVAGNVRQLIEPGERVMVVLDSAHQRDHVLAELDLYAPLVAPGCYLIVEDTNLNGHPAQPGYGPGPWEALEKWLPRHPEFTVDRGREKHLRTFHPGGYLRRD
jgi:cephalosporin hydroxylase